MKKLLHLRRHLATAAIFTTAVTTPYANAQVINSTWQGDGTGNFSNGNWSDANLWNPNQVPNNAGPTLFDVTIPFYPGGAQFFNGPKLDISVTVRNLTLVNRVFLDNQGAGGTNLTVTGTTVSTTTAGHDGEYAAIFTNGGTYMLGTLANYDAGTHSFNGLFVFPINNTTIGFRNADIWRNNGTIILGNTTGRLVDQDTNQNAIRNISVNDGGLTIGSGIDFTTVGNYTNNSGMTVESTDGSNTRFTVSGSFTNFDVPSKALGGGFLSVEVRDTPGGTAVFRFPNADIRTINGATIKLVGSGASIQDLAGQNALRNLSGTNGGNLTNAGTLTITPNGGTFTQNGGTHEIDSGANITIAGSHQTMNNGTVRIGAPTDSSSTILTINGSSAFNGGGLDFGGTPGVNTQYHTELHVINGIEFRGAYLTGTGTTFADVGIIQGSVFSPGHSPGQVTIEGALNIDADSTLQIQIGGTTEGEQFDQVVQHGPKMVTVGGTLDVSLIDGFENNITNGDAFDIVTSEHNIAGVFANVASGERLPTSDGFGSFRVTYTNQKTVTLDQYQPTLKLVSAVSRLAHGIQGNIDMPVAITGTPSIEPRGGGTYHLVFTFENEVVSGAVGLQAPAGGNITGSPTFSGNTMTVDVAGVANAQKLTFSINDLTDDFDQVLDTQVEMYVLNGDVNNDGFVNAADATQTRNRSGQTSNTTNFRADVNHDGTINAADATIVRARSGTSIFPPADPIRVR